ncbi:hypothetical protein CEK26_000694 [Fusarium fujikuroi]|uniref:Uncharacterized protein n=1 Tax=Fusarium fujikuroi TaxID=5127 RepID=A0A5Q3FEJ9_FUSFU|nr:hypothetical protein CEK27_000695 [Fusarium fujikuroi]QGI75788.1 hypothetical protein CEK25_000694 [Fusarium fujikuroi]QGI89479.1 hypothetical protein CEK26_000694 [Fusarium fujikuroi]VTT61471.1 unnamed protein product [Fusarium fujikuroi]VTT63246.1 unnamed protein product [Fusarium fujikuroi]
MERNATYITLTEPLGYFSEFDAFRIQRCIQLLIGRHYLSQLTSNPVSSCQQLKSRYLDADGSALGSSVSHHHIEPQVTEQKEGLHFMSVASANVDSLFASWSNYSADTSGSWVSVGIPVPILTFAWALFVDESLLQ